MKHLIYSNQLSCFISYLHHLNYSDKTIKDYTRSMDVFFSWVKKDPSQISNDDLIGFSAFLQTSKLSVSMQNQFISAAKLYFSYIKSYNFDVSSIERPRIIRSTPDVLSIEDVSRLLKSTDNIKHIAMLSLIYACGLRRSELINIKISDIDKNRYTIFIRKSKGHKDRYVPVCDDILMLLRSYYSEYRPVVYLFESNVKGIKYSASSVHKVFCKAYQKSGIKKPASLHTLRHSFATHLLDDGNDIRVIQKLLGHALLSSTEIYTHISDARLKAVKLPYRLVSVNQVNNFKNYRHENLQRS